MSAPELKIVLLNESHTLFEFDCGVPQLNDYLIKHALSNNQNRSARTYVATRATRVVGYYTLAVGSVTRSDTPARVSKGLANYPVPIILIARLAIERSEHGQGLGKGLLKDALLRCISVSEIAGCRAVLVHAKDDLAVGFYRKFGFESSPLHERHLYLLMKDLIASNRPSAPDS